jgi:ATP-dependent RNA helicase DbpA
MTTRTELPNQPFTGLTALPASLQQATAALGYDSMTAVQAAALPLMLERRDVLAQAKTGSGKTAAFGLALLALLNPELIRLQSLVLCPTRELAEQVSKEIRALARFIPNLKVLSLCGGVPVHIHKNSLTHPPHVAVGTPGRIIDLIESGDLQLDGIQTVVLDEADRMLDMGFLEQVMSILKHTPSERLTWLFSATYPTEIRELSQHFQREPVEVTVEAQHEASVITQIFYRVDAAEKAEAVVTLLLQQQASNCLIFCNTKIDVKDLCDFLWKRSIPALALHGDLEQRDRDETLLQFANGSCRVLIATDVAARGLDIKALPLVLAFELPNDAESHTHRIGRTGRAGERGLAISLVAGSERARLERIEEIASERYSLSSLPARSQQRSLPAPQFSTLVIDGGRQDKLRPGDIVGALTGDGGLTAEQIGKIDVFATRAYVAVTSGVLATVVTRLQKSKIKGKSFRVRKL